MGLPVTAMATELIYFLRPDILAFDATVVEVGPAQAVPELPAAATLRPVVLDRTAFYPGGGGQPCDTGHIGTLPVLAAGYLPDRAGVVAHWVAAVDVDEDAAAHLPKPGDVLHCAVDRSHRFDLMQQHTGQHIISAVAMRDFGAATVGFHLTAETATVDLAFAPTDIAGPATLERLMETLEDRACQIVFADRPVRIHLVEPGQAPQQAADNGLELRVRERGPAPKGGDQWRVIEVDGLDLSPCGGTHVASTGQVGLITIQRWESVRDGVRLEFACGQRALAAHRWRRDALRRQAQALSVHEREAVDQALRALSEAQALGREVRALRVQLLEHRALALVAAAERLPGGVLVTLRDDELDADDLKYLANAICAGPGRVALLAAAAGGVPRLVFARSDDLASVNAGRMLTQAVGQMGGRGGGPPKLGQGGGGDPAALAAVMAWAADESRRLLGG